MGIFFFSRGATEDGDRRRKKDSERIERDRKERKERRDQGRHPDNRR